METDEEILGAKKRKVMHFDGVCPLLLCLADCPHDHPICPKCGAVGYGNICCDWCRKNVDIHRELAIIEIRHTEFGGY